MGQYDVLGFLEKNKGKWFTVNELSENINLNRGTLSSNVSKLRRHNLIESRITKTRTANAFEYKHKENESV